MSEEKGEYKTQEEKRVLVFRNMHNKENPYAMVSKECLDDSRLSWKARGLLAYLLGKPDTWEVISEHLKKQASDGARSLRSGLFELQFFGYLEKFIEKDKGKFKQFGYNIYESSQKPDATVLEYENIKKKRLEDEKKRKVSRNQPFLRFAQMENSTLVSNDIVNNELIYRCSNCLDKGEEMCEKCEYLKKKIEIGEQFGFEHDNISTRKQLKELEKEHKNIPLVEEKKSRLEELLGSGDEYSIPISDYPERLQTPLRLFVEKWRISSSAIPRKPKGKKGGMYATWINGIEDLMNIAKSESKYKLVLDKAYQTWDNRSSEFKNQIDMPQKIRGLFVTADSEVSIENENKSKEKSLVIEIKKDAEFISAEEFSKLLKK